MITLEDAQEWRQIVEAAYAEDIALEDEHTVNAAFDALVHNELPRMTTALEYFIRTYGPFDETLDTPD